MTRYVGVSDLSEIAGVSRQAIEKAIASSLKCPLSAWRGASLMVRTVHGRGGRSGLQYQVLVDSLPIDLQRRVEEAFKQASSRPAHGAKAQAERDWWFGLIQPALAHEKHSRERGDTLKALAGRKHMAPDGTWRAVSERTLQRVLAAYEAHGLAGLGRRKRADAGASAVILSRAWDGAVPFDDETKERIAEDLRQFVRGLVKDGVNGAQLKLFAQDRLAKITRRAGFEPGEGGADKVFSVPNGFLARERAFRNVYTFKTDRKAHEDTRRARVRRSREGLMPMDIVVAGVHPVDILYRRADGSTATLKAVSWLDLATNRVFMSFVALNRGEGVTNADVIASFIQMVAAWGCPRALYYDNGSEYNWMAFIDDALKLIDGQSRALIDRIAPWGERSSNIVRALPYNAAAKPIESVFKVLEQKQFRFISGWIGGDRMRKKTANVGKEPAPFPGTVDELRAALRAALDFHHATPSDPRSALKGLSPNAAFAQAVSEGWGRVEVDPDALRLAFSRPERRKLHQGAIRFGGRAWSSDAPLAHPRAFRSLMVPKYEEHRRLAVRDEHDRFLCFVEHDEAFAFLDPRGAQESARRQGIQRASLRALARSAPDIDVPGERRAMVAALPPPPEAPVAARIAPADDQRALIEGMRETTVERADRENREAQGALRRRLAVIDRINKKGRAGA